MDRPQTPAAGGPEVQTDPTDDPTFKVFKLSHDIPICESVSPNSSFRWHSMDDEAFVAYRKRLETEIRGNHSSNTTCLRHEFF